VEQETISTITEGLTDIWQKVLERSCIGGDDNFIDLGGDSAKAVALFEEIATLFRRRLPPVLIYVAPTIGELAKLLASPENPAIPAVLLLKPGTTEKPIFLVHGLGGSALEFFDLVKDLETARAIYGTQAKGTDGLEKPAQRIEEAASYILEAIRKAQPHGAYTLIGYSLGGLVALEIARKLQSAGGTVDLLCMIESYPAIQRVPLTQRLRINWRVGRMRILEKLRGGANSIKMKDSLTPEMQHVKECDYIALEKYEPRPYSGKVHFVKARKSMHFPDNPKNVWGKLIPQIEIETVASDHHGILRERFKELSAVLSRHLAQAEGADDAHGNRDLKEGRKR
jgi:acetoacetyl-CoA synthetase